MVAARPCHAGVQVIEGAFHVAYDDCDLFCDSSAPREEGRYERTRGAGKHGLARIRVMRDPRY